ncbi:MAG: class I SAM-dependent methyltransferase [Chloroflexota bacterium]
MEASFYDDIQLPAPSLDLGCGDGHFASLTFDRPLEVGVDPWWGSLREASGRDAYRGLVQADGARMPFPDAYFASAVSNSVLEHIPHLDAVLAETARLLRPGAPFVFCVPNERYLTELTIPGIFARLGLRRLGDAYTEWFRRMSRVHHANPPEVWDMRLQQAGFTLENWWHYFSPEAMRVLEWGHYFGLPSLVAHWLTGRWILIPTRWNLTLTRRIVRSHAKSESHPQGTFTFYVARRK